MSGDPVHKLRLVRSVLRSTIVARQARGIMRAGIGSTADASGAVDVFGYVAADAKTAIKSQKDSDGSADYCESIGRLALMIGASAQAAAALTPPSENVGVADETRCPYGGALREAARAFTAEAVKNGELVPKIAAALDAALGSCAV